ncbi:trigger factor [Deltaproteobacteria bacterium]|nr:trigger factor [Deltaproteobacteria bacterium]
MEYKVEELSPVRKKVIITTEPQEVEAAIMGAVALYKTSVQLDGFRKGKVPASVIEQRFRQKIYEEAHQDLVNVHLNEVMQTLGVTPVSGIDLDGPNTLERGSGYTYSIEFEVLPEFDLPPYEGLDAEQEKVVLKEEVVTDVIERILRDRAQLLPVDGLGPAVDGQVVNLDFAAYENGKAVEGVNSKNFNLALGERQALEDFEALVKTIQYGQEGESEIRFPDDFLARDLAGKTVTMKVKVHAIKERKLPELNDELAKSLGVETVDKLKQNISDSYVKSRTDLNKSATQKNILDKLLKMTKFPLPQSMVDIQINTLLAAQKARLERYGKSLESLGKSPDTLRVEVLPQAEEITRYHVLMLSIAKKEGLDVTDQEINAHIYQASLQSGDDFKTLHEQYERSGMIFALRDRLLADKAMELVYANARVKEVEPSAGQAAASGCAISKNMFTGL